MLRAGGPARDRLLAVLGASAAFGDHLARHPAHWTSCWPTPRPPRPSPAPPAPRCSARSAADPAAAEPVAALATAGSGAALDALRVTYRRLLLAIAGHDLAAPDPAAAEPAVSGALADLAAGALEAALAIARAELPAGSAPCRIAVVAMGKCGGRELNYVSDVDVIYVVEPREPAADGGEPPTSGALATARAGGGSGAGLLRAARRRACSGRSTPRCGRRASAARWCALSRATSRTTGAGPPPGSSRRCSRPAPSRATSGWGRPGSTRSHPLVWRAAEREHFVEDVQAMRRRVEEHVPAKEAGRQLKLGPGGLRDVEFTVQLLQLVHGRVDPRLRTGNTLEALEALATYGYVGRDDAAELDRAYRFLRALEHRLQLYRLRRTHVVPADPADLRRLGRAMQQGPDPARELEAQWHRHALEVRRLHEKLFYRPLLAAAARLSTDEVRLTPDAARARLAALGYRDPAGALRHLGALTAGVSRRAAIQRQLLPVLLGWFADGADPDAGLLAFRRLSEELGTTHWYLKMLRDSGAAAERMAHVLSASGYVAQLLEKGPEAVALLGDDDELVPRPREVTLAAVGKAVERHAGDPDGAARAALAVRRRELVRTSIADVAGLLDHEAVGRALADAAVAALDGGLRAATDAVERRLGGPLPTRMLVVAMGRLGGAELGYGSDADVLFVHEPLPGEQARRAEEAAAAVAGELRRLLASPGPEPALAVDADLRPEGRNGPLVRTLQSYAEYYSRWSLPWEAQALTRAVPVAGDPGLGRRFEALVDPIRWPAGGLGEGDVREVRRIKARVEAERLPRGADPHRHLKLGRGGLSDVEWTVQLLQLRNAGRVPELRTPSTLHALRAARDAGLVDLHDAEALAAAWTFAARVRNAVVLWRGRPADSLPTGVRELEGVARLVGYPPASAGRLDDDYQRVTRRARGVVERLFYDG